MFDPLMDALNALRQRGVSFTVVNNRLRVHPKHAYKTLRDEEREFLRLNRSAIKARVLSGLPPLAAPVAANGTDDSQRHNPTQTPLPFAELERERAAERERIERELRAERARAARDAYIKQHDPETWRLLHFNDPDEILRRNNDATAVMNSPYQPPIHNW